MLKFIVCVAVILSWPVLTAVSAHRAGLSWEHLLSFVIWGIQTLTSMLREYDKLKDGQ